MKKKALVAGALGVIGRSLIEELEKQQDWEINGITRRVSEKEDKSNSLSLDLMNREACRRKLGQLNGITHLFYCAFQPRPSVSLGPYPGPSSSYISMRPVMVAFFKHCSQRT